MYIPVQPLRSRVLTARLSDRSISVRPVFVALSVSSCALYPRARAVIPALPETFRVFSTVFLRTLMLERELSEQSILSSAVLLVTRSVESWLSEQSRLTRATLLSTLSEVNALLEQSKVTRSILVSTLRAVRPQAFTSRWVSDVRDAKLTPVTRLFPLATNLVSWMFSAMS